MASTAAIDVSAALVPILDLTSTNEIDDDEIFLTEEIADKKKRTMSTDMAIAKEESRAVVKSKIAVYLVVLGCSLTTSVVTWFFVRREETDTFRDEFRQFASTIVEGANANIINVFDQVLTLSTSLTSHTLLRSENGYSSPRATPVVAIPDNDDQLPSLSEEWYSLPHFGTKVLELQSLAGTELILWAPLVTNVAAWENYTQTQLEEIARDSFSNTPLNPNDLSLKPPSPRVFPVPPEYQIPGYSSTDQELVVPVLQYGPLTTPSNALLNLDLNSHVVLRQAIDTVVQTQKSVLVEVANVAFLVPDGITNQALEKQYFQNDGINPQSVIVEPIFDRFAEPHRVTGVLLAMEPWSAYFEKNLPDGLDGFLVDLKSTCGENADRTFRVNGKSVIFEGNGDLHDPEYDSLGQDAPFPAFAVQDVDTRRLTEDATVMKGDNSDMEDSLLCDYSITVYPSHAFEDTYHTSEPYLYATLVLVVFLITVVAFAIYDLMVQRRQRKVLRKAQDSTQLVQSLFPREVGQRLMEDAEQKRELREIEQMRLSRANRAGFHSGTFRTKFYKQYGESEAENSSPQLADDTCTDTSLMGTSSVAIEKGDPIAEYYPESTIMFADMVGFTSWSSVREPKTVFTLLESLYGEFDTKAKQRRVFKIETVGDCYVAVAGVPEPHAQHFVAMARFARDCLISFAVVTKQLETVLGPETSDLALRVGLHSGPVTGGVLRNDRARFQLFGDTMNVASRMESTGSANRIHISEETAELLRSAGKGHWLKAREELVFAKGKGKLQTYWIVGSEEATSTSSGELNEQLGGDGPLEQRRKSIAPPTMPLPELAPGRRDEGIDLRSSMRRNSNSGRDERLASWNVDILGRLLQQVVAGRRKADVVADSKERLQSMEIELLNQRSTPFQELEETIAFPPNYTSVDGSNDVSGELDLMVAKQLKEYIHAVLSSYRNNDFHSFEHASNVTLSLMKLFSRVIPPSDSSVPDHTLGLGNHAYAQFCMGMAAMIHDVDHTGLSNKQLIEAKTSTSCFYRNQSVAEQNSIDVAWKLLMNSEFQELRHAIYTNEAEFKFFRKMIVHCVLATDILDPILTTERAIRWMEAFDDPLQGTLSVAMQNLQRTVVIESLMQASDILHTMQHWQIYVKWNARLFQECHSAYEKSRNSNDNPALSWYENEQQFLESCVVPLATRLQESGIFGLVSGREFLHHALRNQEEWTRSGRGIVEDWKQELLME